MDIFDHVDPPLDQPSDPDVSRSQDPVLTPDRLMRTVDGPVPAPHWPATHVHPPMPYSPDRHPNGQFAPGNSANPKGRPVSFANLIRHYSADGLEFVAFAFGILRGEVTHGQFHPKTGEIIDFEASPATKVEVMKWLTDRGLGKEVARLDVTSGGETINPIGEEECPDLSKLTTEEVRTYLQLRMKALAAPRVIDVTPEHAP